MTIRFVMPAYNAAPYIAEAIESILAQTIGDWVLTVADDCSTDATHAIAAAYAARDPRIRLLRTPEPSGSAYRPRRLAIIGEDAPRPGEEETETLIAPLDADDTIPPDYLERLLELRAATGSDIIYPTMCDMGSRTPLFPTPEALYERPHAGREMVRHTLDGWRIGCNGGLIDRTLYLRTYAETDDSITYSCADELLTRQLLCRARSVALCRVSYFYRANPDSITRRPSPRLFDYLLNNLALTQMLIPPPDESGVTTAAGGVDQEELRLMRRQLLHGIFDAMRLLNRLHFPTADRDRAMRLISECREALASIGLPADAGAGYLRLYRLPTAATMRILRLADRLIPLAAPLRRAIAAARREAAYRHGDAAARAGFPAPDTPEEELRKRLYTTAADAECEPPAGVIMMLDGEIHHGGITDRMRGILTAYAECRRRGIPFHIHWTHPFPLTDYYLPATFDWRIAAADICRDLRLARPAVADDIPDRQARRRIRAAIAAMPRQLHLYTNADYARGDYARLYAEVFRPAPIVEREAAYHRQRLGKGYWSATTRFLTLLGDFTDWLTQPLPPAGQQELMEKTGHELLRLLDEMPSGTSLLLTSDSKKFLDYARTLSPRIYTVDGPVSNIDLGPAASDTGQNDLRRAWLKTFVDQQLIMGADRVVRLRTGLMYPTGFPRFAAETGGRPFRDIVF